MCNTFRYILLFFTFRFLFRTGHLFLLFRSVDILNLIDVIFYGHRRHDVVLSVSWHLFLSVALYREAHDDALYHDNNQDPSSA